ncbi:MAG: MOSC domain-containing protein [Terriglobus roseus]|nr:MOSC domain-containing protein [Terriglobus roseus]
MRSHDAYIEAVSLSPRHGFSKQPQPSIHLLAGLGVQGDAHCGATMQHVYLKRRDPAAPNHMQVHLLQAELLEELAAKGFHIGHGQLGENILTRGVDLLALSQGTELRLGDHAVLRLTCLREPCAQIERFRPGLQREMYGAPGDAARYRIGVMAVVLTGGPVAAGDAITVTPRVGPHVALTA